MWYVIICLCGVLTRLVQYIAINILSLILILIAVATTTRLITK